jgi:holin-like protein
VSFHPITNAVYTGLAIAFCLGVGKLLSDYLPGLPASLYGMLLYCLLLQLTILNPKKISQTNQWIIKHMGICFVPAAVGVINHYELIKHHGISLVLLIFITTFVLLTCVGLMAERYLAPKSKDKT